MCRKVIILKNLLNVSEIYRNSIAHLPNLKNTTDFLNPVTDVNVVAERVEINDNRGTHVEAGVVVGQSRAVKTVALAQYRPEQ